MKAIGIDIGTTSICASVLDGVSGAVLETANIENGAFIDTPHPWEKIQDPALILKKATDLVTGLLEKHAPVAAVGVTGQMHGIVYLDKSGDAVSPLYIWQDGRGDLELDGGETYVSRLAKITGYKLATGYGAATHYYNLKNGLVPAGAERFCTIHDYVAMKLSGRAQPLAHTSDAASFGLFDLEKGDFDATAIKAAGMDPAFFPEVTKGYDILGKTACGAPVAAAIGDNQASFIGSVRDMENSILVNVGTGSQISLMSPGFVREKTMETRPCMGDSYILVGASLCGGRAYAILEGFFRAVADMAGPAPGAKLYPVMDALSEGFETLENKLDISTLFSGTRENPRLRGHITNLGIDSFTPQHFIVGVLEGTVAELYDMYSTIESLGSKRPGTLVGSGNGIRKSDVMCAMFAKKFGMEVKVPEHREEAAYGAALFAMVGVGAHPDIKSAQKIIRYRSEK